MGSLWQYYRDEPALSNAGAIANFHAANNGASVKLKQNIIGKTIDGGTKDVEVMVSLQYLSNFLRTLKISLINCEINLNWTWSDKCVLFNYTKATTFTITDTKIHVLLVTLSTQDNAKLLHQLKLGFKRTINWNKYQSKVAIQAPNPYLDYLIDPSF